MGTQHALNLHYIRTWWVVLPLYNSISLALITFINFAACIKPLMGTLIGAKVLNVLKNKVFVLKIASKKKRENALLCPLKNMTP